MARRIGPFQSIAVFGGANMDRIARSAGSPVMGASNPGGARTLPGGVGLNLATTLARLGHETRLVTRLGADPDGETIVAAATAAGVDTAFIGVSPAARTASYHCVFDDQGGLIIGIADMDIYAELTPQLVARATARLPADDLWVIDANLPADTLDFIVGEAASAGRPVAALCVSPVKAERLGPLLDRITLLFANRREAAAVLGRSFDDRQPTALDLARALADEQVRHVVISDGADPVVVAAGGEIRSLAPLKARVRSVNGGGDALAAGTIHGLAAGRTLFEAAISGLAAAAIAVEGEATILAELTPQALRDRIASAGAKAPA